MGSGQGKRLWWRERGHKFMTLSSVGQLLGFLGPVVIMVTTGNTKLGAVHSFAPPCWAHYVGWMAVSLGFLFQLIG